MTALLTADPTLLDLKPSARCERFLQELAGPGELDGSEWPAVYKNRYPRSWWYHFKLCFDKKLMMLLRDRAYVRSQIMSALFMGVSRFQFVPGGDREAQSNFIYLLDQQWSGTSKSLPSTAVPGLRLHTMHFFLCTGLCCSPSK